MTATDGRRSGQQDTAKVRPVSQRRALLRRCDSFDLALYLSPAVSSQPWLCSGSDLIGQRVRFTRPPASRDRP